MNRGKKLTLKTKNLEPNVMTEMLPQSLRLQLLIKHLNDVNNPNWSHLIKLPPPGSPPPTSPPLHPLEAAQRLAAFLQSAALAASAANSEAQEDMKVPPISLTGGHGSLPPPLHFSPDFLWRYPNPFFQPPPSPLESQLKAHLPGGLGSDPRLWLREDVMVFLRYCEREFDLEKIDMDKFQMNGKALCLLTKNDFAERCGGAGDVIHNILQMLIRESSGFPPSSPLTSRPPLMTPTSPAPGMPWGPLLSPSVAETFPNLSHLISQTNSVTLSPAPSIDSQTGKMTSNSGVDPLHHNNTGVTSIRQLYPGPSHSHPHSSSNGGGLTVPPPLGAMANGSNRRSNSASSSHSDSEDSSSADPSSVAPSSSAPTSSSKDDMASSPELNTNGRLLWDFLQQLLNDQGQRYTSYIAWKNKETGVFKIVDPAGLAKLWGIQKNHLSMNYDKMSRALRYYYRVNILRKVQGERHCYQFLRNPSELKSIKNISLLRQQMEAQAAAQKMAAHQAAQAAYMGMTSQKSVYAESGNADQEVKSEPEVSPSPFATDDEPTDLTLDAEEKAALRMRERLERQRFVAGRTADESEREREQHEPRPSFDFRHLIPQVSIKTENC